MEEKEESVERWAGSMRRIQGKETMALSREGTVALALGI